MFHRRPFRRLLIASPLVRHRNFSAEAQALFARFTTPPTSARKTAINNLIVSLKAAGVWAKLDAFYVLAAADAQAARLNWKPAPAFNLSVVGSPTFTADRGYAGNGTTAYLDTGFDPAVAAGNYSQNSAHLAVWNNTSRVQNSTVALGVRNNAQTEFAALLPFTGTTTLARLNSAVGGTPANNASSLGHFIANRSASNAVQIYKDGAAIGSNASASVSLLGGSIFIGGENRVGVGLLSGSTDQFGSDSIGGSLSAGEVAAYRAALLTYMQSVGNA
ncbi:hypothetical protein NKH48_03270 [Mesorhizobium sp. M1233]|uniref:hypothetical protein n=1 Tax=Mesorhizobium sp. M1233 TaxID=2957072 RepID=UPI00333DFA41